LLLINLYAGELLAKRAELTPDREAVFEAATGHRFTYAELDARANRVANWLRDYGAGDGDRIALLAHNGIFFLDLLFGCARIGAVFTPLNWRLAPAELAYILGDCRPRFLLFDEDCRDAVRALREDVTIEHYVPLDSYEKAIAMRASVAPPRPAVLEPESPLCILYTSGTTGRPKGAIIPHRQVLWNCINTVISWGLSERDVSAVLTPMFHAGGLFVFLTPLLYAGGRIVIAREFDAAESLRLLERERCTVVLGVPTLYRLWLDVLRDPASGLNALDLGHMRWFISGGAPCPPGLMAEWREVTGVATRQGYGLTEVGPNCFTMTDEESLARPGSVGKPVFHSEARLVDPDGRAVEGGETGELVIRGPHVCAGYWQMPEATASAFRDGWFLTGDMARRDADGYYYITGRFKDMIISGGENVYAAEVEAVFMEHPAVAQAALIGRPDDKWGEVGLMIVVLAGTREASADELRAWCRDRLAAYKVPKEVVFTDALPMSAYGKVEKQKLKERYLTHVVDQG
jgi:fatty-acyl-CoA synthase